MTDETKPVVKRVPTAKASGNKLLLSAKMQGDKARAYAALVAQALLSCAVPPRAAASVLQTDLEDFEGYVLGGLTKLSDEIILKLVTALFEIKTAGLDGLRGNDQLALLTLVFKLTATSE